MRSKYKERLQAALHVGIRGKEGEKLSTTLDGVFRHFHPVCPSASVADKPVRIYLADRPIVLFRADERISALDDDCPHRRTPLSYGTVKEGRLHCAYHGWNFGPDGKGAVPLQPKLKCSVRSYTVADRLGYVWLAANDTPVSRLPDFIRSAESLSGKWAGCLRLKPISLLFNSPLPQTLDNFGEVEHVPFIHKVLGWSIEDVPHMTVNVTVGPDHTAAQGWGPQREPHTPFLRLIDKCLFRCGDTSLLEWDMKFSPCHTTFMPGWGNPEDGHRRAFSLLATSVFVPETSHTTRLINFPFVKIHEPRLRKITPVVKYVARKNLLAELTLDKEACEMVADVPNSLEGMRLGKRDKQLVMNRKMLYRLYYGNGAAEALPPDNENDFSHSQTSEVQAS